MAQTHDGKDVKYEDALKRLEKLVEELERPGVELEARLRKFEEGMKLVRVLVKRLEQAKKKVDVLMKTGPGDAALTALEEELEDDADADRTTT